MGRGRCGGVQGRRRADLAHSDDATEGRGSALRAARRGFRKELSPDAAYALIEQLAPTFVARDRMRPASATAAAGLPLAVTLIASHLEVEAGSPKAEFAAAIQRVLEQRAWLLDEELSEFDFHLRSLRNAIALSYDRLDSPARGALSYLSVFPPKTNTFSREAADRISGTEVAMPTLRRSGLVELINVDPERYTMHQAVAEFAEEARDDEARIERARRSHEAPSARS